jgi:general secretion pathway protein D
MVSRTGHISSFDPGNLILVVDSGLNINKILRMVKVIDKPAVTEESEVVFLKQADAEAVARMLNEGAKRRAPKGAPQSLAVADKRLNAMVLFGDKKAKDSMKRLIAVLDVEAEEALSTINVYFLEHADAEELAEVLRGIIKTAGQARTAPGAAKKPVSPFQSLSGIVITPDKSTNSLVVVSSPADYQSILGVIRQLDIRRKQVFVEALIVEATVDDLLELGSKWRVAAKHDGEPIFITGVGRVDADTISSILTGVAGLSAGGLAEFFTVPVLQDDGTTVDLEVPGIAALFSLSEFESAFKILSTPQILTSDNSEAEIVVAENVPFISTREITTQDSVLNSIERKDVGIILRITPQITQGNFVNLEIYQEISALREQATAELIESVGPITTKRSTTTNVIVKDGETVVISGLMQERDEITETRVPLLHRIPLLGWFFKFRTNSEIKTNLLVFITPRVIRSPEHIADITNRKSDEMARRTASFVENELLVKFREGVAREQAMAVLSIHGAVVLRHYESLNLFHIRLRKGLGVEEALEEFQEVPEVEYAEPNYTVGIPEGEGGVLQSPVIR